MSSNTWIGALLVVSSIAIPLVAVAISRARSRFSTRIVAAPDGRVWRLNAAQAIASPAGALERLQRGAGLVTHRGWGWHAQHPPAWTLTAELDDGTGRQRVWITPAPTRAIVERDLDELERHVRSGSEIDRFGRESGEAT
jgi:hypothetical protein